MPAVPRDASRAQRARRPSPGGGSRETLHARLLEGAAQLRLDLSERQAGRLLDYLALLAKWNAVYNLTSIREPERMLSAHLLDCLAAVPELALLSQGRPMRVLDVGSGAGLPGIVWAIAMDGSNRPRLGFTLVDAVDKKTAFQRQAVAELGLDNVECVHARIEQWRAPAFDLVSSRAYSALGDLVGGTRHLIAPEGRWVALKGEVPEAELAALPPDVRVDGIVRLAVPGLDGAARCLVLLASPA